MNPPCINCLLLNRNNIPNQCICNNEIRCNNCKKCQWCISKNFNGKCVPNSSFNKFNCPNSYPFNYNINHNNHNNHNNYNIEMYNIIMLFVALIFLILFILILTNNYY